jgi:phosphoribosylamine--glycine ligase
MICSKRVLIVGAGAREHALGAALASGGHEVVTAPGNAGTALVGRNASVRLDDTRGLVELAERERAELVVVGPEGPLALGLVDALEERGIRAFGPTRAAARLETSKAFMKHFCSRYDIPTAPFAVFDDPDQAERHVRANGPLVVKADGLAAGKGVVVASTVDEACSAIDRIMRKREFGQAGATVVLEERLEGEEASFHVVSDGARAIALVSAQDHKRLCDGDQGPNTGGMGACAPARVVTPDVHESVLHSIVEPTLAGMASEGTPFRGALFVGLMIEDGRARVLEYNVRFGDPEAVVIAPLYEGDWFELLAGAASGDISGVRGGNSKESALAVVMASAGYPGHPRVGETILGLDAAMPSGVFIRHAGTVAGTDGSVQTAGGRVLAVGAKRPTLAAAAEAAYAAVGTIRWAGEQHRSDIGWRALAPGRP